jgi:hypothetical protein
MQFHKKGGLNMRLSKFDLFQALIVGLVFAICAAAIPVMSQTPTSHQPINRIKAAAIL